jgi:hypothetical protein
MTMWFLCVQQLKKKKKMMASLDPGSSSSFALEKKNQETIMNQYGPPPLFKIK